MKITMSGKMVIAALLVVAVIAAQFVLLPWLGFGADREMVIAGTGHFFIYDFDAGAAFHSNDSRFFFFASRDGMQYRTSNGNIIWRETLSFNNPWLSARGDYVAIGEQRGGRVVYVFNSEGQSFRVALENPIVSFSVNETGFLTVIAQYDRGYGIYVFNRYRSAADYWLFHWDMPFDLLWPTHAEVSPDGRYIAVAIADLTMGVQTRVQFRYISAWDAWNTDQGLFGHQDFFGLVTALRFVDNNRLIISTTSQITAFQMGPSHATSRQLWQHDKDNVITNIAFFGNSHFAYVVGERLPMATSEGYPAGTLHIYTTNGTRTGTFNMGRRASHLRMGQNAVLIGAGRSFVAVDFRGAPMWEHITLYDTMDVLFLENTSTILVAGSNRAEVYERQRLRDYISEDYEI